MVTNSSQSVSDRLCIDILDTIAAEEGDDKRARHSFDPPLHQAVNCDLLGTFVDDESLNGEIQFSYRGYDVTVSGGGEVKLDE